MKYLLIVIIVFICWMVINAIRIYNYSDEYFEDESDVAIVLGAGTNNGKISPIYRERVNHSINPYYSCATIIS